MAYKVFLSCVSNEFGDLRQVLADDLRALDVIAVEQENFRPDAFGDTVLRDLREKVRGCDAVICIHGAQSGWFPPATTAQEFRNLLPSGTDRASATQWEYYFAKKYHKRLHVFRGAGSLAAGHTKPASDDDPVSQQNFRDLVEHLHGHHYFTVHDVAELRIKVQQIPWRQEQESSLASVGWQILVPLMLFLIINLVSLASNGGTVLNLFPIVFHGPKPAARFLVSGDKTQRLFIAQAYDTTPRMWKITPDNPAGYSRSSDPSKVPPLDVWSTSGQVDNEVAFQFGPGTASDADGGKTWTVRFRHNEGPCIEDSATCHSIDAGADPWWGWEDMATWAGPGEAQLARSSLNSRYDDLVAQGKMIAVLFSIGFSTLIAIMGGEIVRFGRAFTGAARWDLVHARKP